MRTINGCRNIVLATKSTFVLLWFIALLKETLSKAVPLFAYNTEEMEEYLNNTPQPDMIMVDTELEDHQGEAILRLLASRKVEIPVIIFYPYHGEGHRVNLKDINLGELNIVGRFTDPVDSRGLLETVTDTIIKRQKDNDAYKLVKEPKKVLLAIADDSVREAFSDILSTILLKGTLSRADSIEAIKEALNDSRQPDLIVIDGLLRDDMARDMARLLLAHKSRVPIAFINSPLLADIEGINDINVACFLVRPINRKREFHLLEQALMGL